ERSVRDPYMLSTKRSTNLFYLSPEFLNSWLCKYIITFHHRTILTHSCEPSTTSRTFALPNIKGEFFTLYINSNRAAFEYTARNHHVRKRREDLRLNEALQWAGAVLRAVAIFCKKGECGF